MSINIDRYVDITSGVGATSNIPPRALIGRLFTANSLVPPNTFVQFDNAADVATFFGAYTEEATRAAFYFSWISKNITQPAAIQYARWVNSAVAPMIKSVASNGSVLGNWTSIANGSFGLTIGGVAHTFTSLDFTAAASLAAVATIIEDAIQLQSGTMWTAATVVASAGGFTFTGGSQIDATISVQAGQTGTDITGAGLLGWLPAATFTNGIYVSGSVQTAGQTTQSITDVLTASANMSNNFGSFLFLNNLALNLSQVTEAATWNYAQNNLYMYTVPVTNANSAAWSAALALIGGVGLTFSPAVNLTISGTVTSTSNTITALGTVANLQVGMLVTGANIPASTYITAVNTSNNSVVMSNAASGTATEIVTFTYAQYPEQVPMMVEAATNYNQPNSVQNYMFQTDFAGLIPSVTTDTEANFYDNLLINYYGQTQDTGVFINFYQRGVLLGSATSPRDMNTYANEIWLKTSARAAILNLFIVLGQLPANEQGRSQVLNTLQEVINQALLNGTISVNKALTQAQRMYIGAVTNDPDAWYQVETIGYWLDCAVVASGNPIQFSANYTLVYSKDDVIRLVNGTDILI